MHHAKPDRGRPPSGFSFFNDAVLACLHLEQAGCRVLYLDLDEDEPYFAQLFRTREDRRPRRAPCARAEVPVLLEVLCRSHPRACAACRTAVDKRCFAA
jgi:hypothetical protein